MPAYSTLGPAPDRGQTRRKCEQDMQSAFEQYCSIYHSCFKPAGSPGPFGDGSPSSCERASKECHVRLHKRDTESLRQGTLKGNGDDTIEYCLRLLTGMRARVDEETAYALLHKVIESEEYTPLQRALAANLACTYYKRQLWDEQYMDSRALLLADTSCKFGLFSWDVLLLIQLYEKEKKNPEIHMTSTVHLWREYAKYREETGIQRMTKALCAKCGKLPKRGNKMKQCCGDCISEKKPVYCSRACQKADWPKHKKWCKLNQSGE